MKPRKPDRSRLVLVGGGHSHLAVLRRLGMKPLQGLQITLIAKELNAPYSGMLPGLIAGSYSYDQCHIDLLRLAQFAGARVIHGEVDGIDPHTKRISLPGRPPLGYDILSVDVGITPDADGIAGAAEHGIAVKPISAFYPVWTDLLDRCLQPDGPRNIAVIGGGAAGYEMVLAIRQRILSETAARGLPGDSFSFALMAGRALLPALSERAGRMAKTELADADVKLVEGDPVVKIEADRLVMESGKTQACEAAVLCTPGRAASWFADTGLPLDERGFFAIRPTLQSVGDDDIFAVGDCAAMIDQPRPKAGVFAVRQGPYLAKNIERRFKGRPLAEYRAQKRFLMLLSNARRSAIAVRGAHAMSGALLWQWKDHIDRKFMRRFQDLPQMDDAEAEMRCGGCGAKVGPATLDRALSRTGLEGARDDAALIESGEGGFRIESVDFFRAFWPEPYVLGEIAAHHALGDILAMGGKPRYAQLICALPYASPKLTEDDLFQMVSGARATMDAQGVSLIGGHSSEAEEMAIGFSVSGTVDKAQVMRKGGLVPGQTLILTRPLGSGIVFAAMMRRQADAAVIDFVLDELRRSQADASAILAGCGATGATDVTGFGLAGHLREMVMQSAVDAELTLSDIPLYDTVAELAEAGISSSLLPENTAYADVISGAPSAAETAVLFDPQTAGGLLAGVPAEKADDCLQRLLAAGYRAAIIGTVNGMSSTPRIRLSGHMAQSGGADVDGRPRHDQPIR